MKYETSWHMSQDFNFAVQMGQISEYRDMPHCGDDSYEEHCKKESAPWRFV